MTDHEMQSQGLAAQKDRLFCDLKTDEEKAAFFLSGRGYESGVIAHSIQNDVAMAYHRCSEYLKEMEKLQAENERLREKVGLIICDECHAKCSEPYTGLFASHCHDEEPCIMCECSSLRRQLASLSGGAGGEHEEDRVMEQPAEQQPYPEGVREGAPYDDPLFESLCREHEIWGTPAAAQCAVFWEAGKRVAEQKPDPEFYIEYEILRRAMSNMGIAARSALAAYRKGGDE